VKRTVLSIIVLFLACSTTKGQITVSGNYYNCMAVKGCYGFIADVNNRNHLLIHNHITPLEISLRQAIPVKHDWQGLIPGAEKGISLKYIDLKNREYLGSMLVLAPFINVPVILRKPWRLCINASLGVVYAQKIYHRTENYRNTIFGSHLNAAFGFGLENAFNLSKSFVLSTGIDFFHYSNGETTLPNDGINIGNAFVSAGYRFRSRIIPVTRDNNSGFRKSGNISIVPVFGWKDLSPVKSERYFTEALSAEYSYYLTRIQNVGAGIALFYDGSVRKLYEEDVANGEDIGRQYRQLTSGLYLIHDFNLFPVMFHIQAGYYLLDDRIKTRNRFFNRFGLRYFISERYFINITHKSHFFFKGDNLEWGMGYIFR
jgi:hypothetical protein